MKISQAMTPIETNEEDLTGHKAEAVEVNKTNISRRAARRIQSKAKSSYES